LRNILRNLCYTCLITTIRNNRIRMINLVHLIDWFTLTVISIIIILHWLVITSHLNKRLHPCLFESTFSWFLSFHDWILFDVGVSFVIGWFYIRVMIIPACFITLSEAFHKISVLIAFHIVVIYSRFTYDTVLVGMAKQVILV
jgi:hypothetical protein